MSTREPWEDPPPASERPERPARPRRPPPRRRTGVPVLAAVIGIVVALLLGVVIGYAARGAPDPASPETLERPVPVVTVTVEAPR